MVATSTSTNNTCDMSALDIYNIELSACMQGIKYHEL